MKIQKPGKSEAAHLNTPAVSKSKDPAKQAMIQSLCNEMNKTIQQTTAKAVAEKRKQRADIEQGS